MQRLPLLLALCALVSLLAACGGTRGETANGLGTTLPVTLTNDGCVPSVLTAPAGDVTFMVTNKGSKTLELYVLSGTKIVAEVEDVAPNFTKNGTAKKMQAGQYTLGCGSKDGPKGTLTVTG